MQYKWLPYRGKYFLGSKLGDFTTKTHLAYYWTKRIPTWLGMISAPFNLSWPSGEHVARLIFFMLSFIACISCKWPLILQGIVFHEKDTWCCKFHLVHTADGYSSIAVDLQAHCIETGIHWIFSFMIFITFWQKV